MLTFEQIKELIEQVAERGLEGLELERSGFRLRIEGKKAALTPAAPAAAPPASAPPGETAIPTTAAPASPAAPAEPAGAVEKAGPPEGSHVLTSPIVGTFYRRPSPESDPYVGIGDQVRKGQVLCIVEAMKLMNEIESDLDGVVLEIYPQNAQPVEFGEPLFAIRPD